MISTQHLCNAFALNLNIIKQQTNGLTYEDSLLQPQPRGNCLNWVLGHILANQNRVLKLLDEELPIDEAEVARYQSETDPITCEASDVIKLTRLLDALDEGQKRVAAGLARITQEELAREIQVGQRTMTIGQRLFGLYFHQTYHTGQTELLRQLAGANDKVI